MKLTAEQVMAIAGKHQPDYCSDTHVCFDWQAIADELNTALGDDGYKQSAAYWKRMGGRASAREGAVMSYNFGGMLTYEQVREAIERNFGKVAVLDDGKPVEWRDDWVCKIGVDYQAIADELNAELGSGECELICYKPELPDSLKDAGVEISAYKCSVCDEPMFSDYNFCPNCGRPVKKVVKR